MSIKVRAKKAERLACVALLVWASASCGDTREATPSGDPTGVEPGPSLTPSDVPSPGGNGEDQLDPIFEDFAAATFSNSTVIDNKWFPLTPGNRMVLDGTTQEDGEDLPHRIVYVVTGLTKELVGVETVAVWIEDYSDDELVEAELAFYAQDDDGNVWFFGEHPEEYEDEVLVDAPTWFAGVHDATPGIMMYANPVLGLEPYFQGWGPQVEWSDFGVVDSVGQDICVTLDCYAEVLSIAESSLGEVGAFQLKAYAPGVGVVKVDYTGEDLSKELLELVSFGPMSDIQIEQYEALSFALEAHAYAISPAYGATPPMQLAGAG